MRRTKPLQDLETAMVPDPSYLRQGGPQPFITFAAVSSPAIAMMSSQFFSENGNVM